MALKCMADNNVNITAQEDARVYDYLAGKVDYVLENVGDKLSLTHTTTTLKVTLGSGQCVLQGRHITNTNSTDISLQLKPNGTTYLVLRYDLSKTQGNEVSFLSTTTIEDDDLNNNGVVRDIVLFQVVTNANGVITVNDKRNFSIPSTQGIIEKEYTILASLWNNNTYTIKDPLIGADTYIYVKNVANATLEDVTIFGAMIPNEVSQSDGQTTFRALGEVPTKDLKVQLIMWNTKRR